MNVIRSIFYQVYSILKIFNRSKIALFWEIVFPIILLILFGSLADQQPSVTVYISGDTTIVNYIESKLNNTGIKTLVVENVVDNPRTYVIEKSLRSLDHVAYIYIPKDFESNKNIHIYSTSSLYANYLSGVLREALFGFLLNNTYIGLPHILLFRSFNISTEIVASDISSREIMTLQIALVIPLSSITVTISLLAMFTLTGLDKRIYISPTSKFTAIFIVFVAVLLYMLESTLVLFLVSRMFLRTSLSFAMTHVFWLTYIINYVIAFALALILYSIVLYKSSTSKEIVAASSMGVPVFLFLAFTSGYFASYEVFPEMLKWFARTLPSFHTLFTARNYVLYLEINIVSLVYQVVFAVILLTVSVLIYPLVKKV